LSGVGGWSKESVSSTPEKKPQKERAKGVETQKLGENTSGYCKEVPRLEEKGTFQKITRRGCAIVSLSEPTTNKARKWRNPTSSYRKRNRGGNQRQERKKKKLWEADPKEGGIIRQCMSFFQKILRHDTGRKTGRGESLSELVLDRPCDKRSQLPPVRSGGGRPAPVTRGRGGRGRGSGTNRRILWPPSIEEGGGKKTGT